MKSCEEYVLQELIELKNLSLDRLKEIKRLEKENKDLKYDNEILNKIIERTIAYVSEFDGEQRDCLLDLLTGDVL